jgi:DNA-binding CsgD family transcriptional regulator
MSGTAVQPRGALLLEREAELASIAEALAAAGAGRGSLLLVQGPAGIGKTTLLRAACAAAVEAGVRTVTARGLALEGDFPFGVVRQLFEPLRAGQDWSRALDGAAALAARAFDPADVGPVEADVPYATLHGLFWLAANLAAERTLVIAVDDAHWADPPSLRWLLHLAGRLDGLRTLVLLAVRAGPGTRAAALLDELRAAGSVLRPAPLSSASTAAVVRARLGGGAADDLCSACYDRTGGNPFMLDALLVALRSAGGEDVDRIEPEPIARAVLRHVAQLPSGAEALTRALAVLGGPAPLRLAAALAGQDDETAARLADALRAAAVLAPGAALEFAHPIVRSAIYDAIPPGERALGHARAATLLERDGAGPERVALHLLRSEPAGSAETVALLRAAATSASGRGAPDAAAAYLRRALEEPVNGARRPAVLLELGLALAADRHHDAPAALREAVELSADARERADRALVSAHVLGLWGHFDDAVAICREALSAADLRPEQLDGLQGELVANACVNPAMAGEAWALTGAHLPSAAGDWRVYAAFGATIRGEPAADALRRLAGVLAEGPGAVASDSLAAVYLLLALVWNDELAMAQAACDAVLEAARTRGSRSMVAHVGAISSMVRRPCGRLEDAVHDARLSLDFKLRTSPPGAVAWAAGLCIEALIELGRLDEADAIAAEVLARRPPPGYVTTVTFLQARGALRCAQGRFDEALPALLEVADAWRGLGLEHPTAGYWRIPAVTAQAALGETREAARLAEDQLALARRVGTPRALGAALRARAATAVRDRAEELLTEAVAVLEPTPARLDLGHGLADLGALLRRAGRRGEARPPLLRALELADRAGAAPLTARVHAELIAAGARPRRSALSGPDALTAAERRVADLAAGGLTNRQIAQRLFVTLPTVETHLRHTFQKLDITSRHDLAAAMSSGAGASL